MIDDKFPAGQDAPDNIFKGVALLTGRLLIVQQLRQKLNFFFIWISIQRCLVKLADNLHRFFFRPDPLVKSPALGTEPFVEQFSIKQVKLLGQRTGG